MHLMVQIIKIEHLISCLFNAMHAFTLVSCVSFCIQACTLSCIITDNVIRPLRVLGTCGAMVWA